MSNYYITQQELADHFGVAKSYITKLKNEGIFDLCFEGKRLIRDCAIKAYEQKPQDASREPQRQANKSKRKKQPKKIDQKQNEIAKAITNALDEQNNINANNEIDEFTDDQIKYDQDLYNDDNKGELLNYLRGAKTPNQKVQIIKDFWIGKINEQKYMTEQKKLIYIDDVVRENQKVIKAIRDKCLSIPSKVAPMVVSVDDVAEAQQIIDDAIYDALSELARMSEKL